MDKKYQESMQYFNVKLPFNKLILLLEMHRAIAILKKYKTRVRLPCLHVLDYKQDQDSFDKIALGSSRCTRG